MALRRGRSASRAGRETGQPSVFEKKDMIDDSLVDIDSFIDLVQYEDRNTLSKVAEQDVQMSLPI